MHYDHLSDDEKQSIAKISDDLCKIEHTEGTDYFARAVLEVPIHGVDEPFLWGIWVSLSKENFDKYTSSWGEHDETDSYFGWLCNRLPYYPDTINLKTNVRPRNGGARPYIELQSSDHLLAAHYHQGLSIQEAQAIAEEAMHGSS